MTTSSSQQLLLSSRSSPDDGDGSEQLGAVAARTYTVVAHTSSSSSSGRTNYDSADSASISETHEVDSNKATTKSLASSRKSASTNSDSAISSNFPSSSSASSSEDAEDDGSIVSVSSSIAIEQTDGSLSTAAEDGSGAAEGTATDTSERRASPAPLGCLSRSQQQDENAAADEPDLSNEISSPAPQAAPVRGQLECKSYRRNSSTTDSSRQSSFRWCSSNSKGSPSSVRPKQHAGSEQQSIHQNSYQPYHHPHNNSFQYVQPHQSLVQFAYPSGYPPVTGAIYTTAPDHHQLHAATNGGAYNNATMPAFAPHTAYSQPAIYTAAPHHQHSTHHRHLHVAPPHSLPPFVTATSGHHYNARPVPHHNPFFHDYHPAAGAPTPAAGYASLPLGSAHLHPVTPALPHHVYYFNPDQYRYQQQHNATPPLADVGPQRHAASGGNNETSPPPPTDESGTSTVEEPLVGGPEQPPPSSPGAKGDSGGEDACCAACSARRALEHESSASLIKVEASDNYAGCYHAPSAPEMMMKSNSNKLDTGASQCGGVEAVVAATGELSAVSRDEGDDSANNFVDADDCDNGDHENEHDDDDNDDDDERQTNLGAEISSSSNNQDVENKTTLKQENDFANATGLETIRPVARSPSSTGAHHEKQSPCAGSSSSSPTPVSLTPSPLAPALAAAAAAAVGNNSSEQAASSSQILPNPWLPSHTSGPPQYYSHSTDSGPLQHLVGHQEYQHLHHTQQQQSSFALAAAANSARQHYMFPVPGQCQHHNQQQAALSLLPLAVPLQQHGHLQPVFLAPTAHQHQSSSPMAVSVAGHQHHHHRPTGELSPPMSTTHYYYYYQPQQQQQQMAASLGHYHPPINGAYAQYAQPVRPNQHHHQMMISAQYPPSLVPYYLAPPTLAFRSHHHHQQQQPASPYLMPPTNGFAAYATGHIYTDLSQLQNQQHALIGGGQTTAAQAPTPSVLPPLGRFKLDHNLISLLPIDAQPTRTRQAYGMDKVWQDEFEQLVAHFASNIAWTLVEVESYPSIRESNSIIGYKGRYLIRVPRESPECRHELTTTMATATSSTLHSGSDLDNGDDDSVATNDEREDHDNDELEAEADSCAHVSSDGDEEGDSGSEHDSNQDDDNSQSMGEPEEELSAELVSQAEVESDCDSGAQFNSTATGSSVAGGLDSCNEPETPPIGLGGHQDESAPCNSETSNHQATDGSPREHTGVLNNNNSKERVVPRRQFPTRFRMFIDSAKVRFSCDSCGHGWTSMKGRVVFWYELFELVGGHLERSTAASGGGGCVDGGEDNPTIIGYCAYKLFGQQCDVCKIENRFERPMWYPEEVSKALNNLYNKIGQIYFGFRAPAIDKQRRAGKPKTSHNSSLCQACHDGVCTDRK